MCRWMKLDIVGGGNRTWKLRQLGCEVGFRLVLTWGNLKEEPNPSQCER